MVVLTSNFVIVLLQIGLTTAGHTYTDFGFSLSTLSLLAGPDMNEEFELGEFAKFRFDFTTTKVINDTLSIDFGAYYNGYSALIFCGDPEVEYTEGEVELTFETSDENIGELFDTLKLDFGTVQWPAQTNFAITFDVMLIHHELYVPGSENCCYWFGAGVEYNSGMANWVTDIAFSLADPKANSGRKKWGIANYSSMNASTIAVACYPTVANSQFRAKKTGIKAVENLIRSF